eukprot:g1323.t1
MSNTVSSNIVLLVEESIAIRKEQTRSTRPEGVVYTNSPTANQRIPPGEPFNQLGVLHEAKTSVGEAKTD